MNTEHDLPKTSHSSIICYHFFPHYRKGIIEELARQISPTFLGDNRGVEGIKAYEFSADDTFIQSSCFYIGKIMVQPKVIWVALTGKYTSYVFLANPNHISTWLAAIICRLRFKNVVFWGHGFKSDKKTKSNFIRKIFFKLANSFYTYGWRAKDNAVNLGFSSKNIHVGYNSLDYNTQLKVRNTLVASEPSDSETLNIICISRLTYACRYDMLFQAIELAKTINPNMVISVTLIGDGPERAHLEKIACDLKIETDFVGELYDEKIIARYISSADVTISPGKIGLTAMHSLMYGTPVISNDDYVSQMPEVEAIVTGHTGEVFCNGSISSLADALLIFKSKYLDRKKTREECFLMIDKIYNPSNQAHILKMAIEGNDALEGKNVLSLFK
ncbi:glycosyltransferase [Pseudomonas sp. GL-B-12]|uniref:glycosyltransferase n=1 Tax=Pseudomonas sp. GL-B-12 TaxID=2832374 RepID=UPI001CBC064D|nr:glycosyltransferase [Pseudomonas sp. GL-B-12]